MISCSQLQGPSRSLSPSASAWAFETFRFALHPKKDVFFLIFLFTTKKACFFIPFLFNSSYCYFFCPKRGARSGQVVAGLVQVLLFLCRTHCQIANKQGTRTLLWGLLALVLGARPLPVAKGIATNGAI